MSHNSNMDMRSHHKARICSVPHIPLGRNKGRNANRGRGSFSVYISNLSSVVSVITTMQFGASNGSYIVCRSVKNTHFKGTTTNDILCNVLVSCVGKVQHSFSSVVFFGTIFSNVGFFLISYNGDRVVTVFYGYFNNDRSSTTNHPYSRYGFARDTSFGYFPLLCCILHQEVGSFAVKTKNVCREGEVYIVNYIVGNKVQIKRRKKGDTYYEERSNNAKGGDP